MSDFQFKKELVKKLKSTLLEKINFLKLSIDSAQESANSEEKSSAGDKYETGRSMSQLNKNMYTVQLAEAEREWAIFNQIDFETTSEIVKIGSAVICNQGNYFISLSAGKIIVNEMTFMCISSQSPIAKTLIGKKKKDKITFNQNTIVINDFF